MAQQGGRIDFQVGFKTDKSGIEDLKKSLQDLQKIKPMNFEGSKDDLQLIKRTAADVLAALSKAFNPNINSINLKTFDNELKTSHRSIEDIYASFSKAGAQGLVAFSQMARSVLTTNQQLKLTHSLINLMGTTMVNTVKWGIASSVMNTFTSSVQGAFTYVESLEKSLTNIRIVTGDSQLKMEQFADSANRAAQELGRSTMDYTKAALTFYQQGLNDLDVQARTEAVLKAQNITGAGSEMADYMTSVWNGYKVANELALLYVDKLAAVADSSASDMSLLAIAMSKVASTASAMGVDVDQLNAQLATVVATTRQAPEAVGTAFKTIYTRLNDIKTGADGAEVSLGNYSGKMAELGFNVLDASGHLRDTGLIMEEIGSRWGDLTRLQQIYLATTMGGQRQVNQLMALFENWTTYSDLLNVSLEAEGTLAEKNSRYMESLGAKMEQLGAAGERVKASLIDSESFGAVIDLLTTGTNLLGTFIEGIGGGGTALLGLGGIATQVFSGVISKEINNAIVNFQNMRFNAEQTAKELELTQQFGDRNHLQLDAIEGMLNAKKEMQNYYSVMSTEQRNEYNELVNSLGVAKEQVLVEKEKVEATQQYENALKAVAQEYEIDFEAQRLGITDYTDSITRLLGELKKGKGDKNEIFTDLNLQVDELETNLGTLSPKLKSMFEELRNLQTEKNTKEQFLGLLPDGDEGILFQILAVKRQITNLISLINNEVKNLTDLSINIDVHTQGLADAKKDLEDAEKAVREYREKMAQALNVQNVVQGLGEVARMTSAFMALGNTIKTAFDPNIAPAEKFFKILMSASYSIPTIVASFSRLKTLTLSLSGALKGLTVVKLALNNLDKARAAIQEKEIANNAIESGQRIALAAEEGVITGAKIAETGATNLLTAAEIKLAQAKAAVAAVSNANPIGVTLLVIAGVVAAMAGLVAAYDAVTMSTKLAGLAIDKFNQKAELTKNTVKQYNTDLGNLNLAKEEWLELSKRAGAYNSTIDNLTESEKTRYFELSNLIAQYNDGAIAGYDEQGNAILNNNLALKETILLLKQKRQELINDTYSGKDFEEAQRGRQTYAKDAGKQSNRFTNIAGGAANDILNYLNSYGDDLDAEMASLRDRLAKITTEGEDSLLKNRELVISIFEKMQDKGLPDAYLSGATIDVLKEYSDKYSEDIKGALTGLNEDIIGALLVSSDENGSLLTQAEDAGITNMRGMISSYIAGLDQETLANTPIDDIVKDINDNLIGPIYEALGKEGISGESLYTELINNVANDERLQDNDFESLKEKNLYVRKKIEDFIRFNADSFRNLTPEAQKALQELFNSIYNTDNLKINFDTGKVENLISKKVDALHERIKEIVLNKRGKGAAGLSNDIISQLLPADITDAELDYIMLHLEEAYEKTGDLKLAILSLQEDGAALSNLENNLGTIDLLNKQAAGDNLSLKEFGELKAGLDTLKHSYGDLTTQVEILNSEWLEGTAQYNEALTQVKSAIIETLAETVAETEGEEARRQKQLEVNDSIINMITTMEDLQLAQDALDTLGQQMGLMRVAAAYESCKNEIEAYALALQKTGEGSGEEQAAAAMDLLRAARAAELGTLYDIEPEKISTLADLYSRLAEQYRLTGDASLKVYEGLDKNAELAADSANAYIRLNEGIAELQKNYDDMTLLLAALADESQNTTLVITDNWLAFLTLKESLADIINVSEDLIDEGWEDWISDYAGLIQLAMDGSQEAVDELKEKATLKIVIELGVDYEALGTSAQAVSDWANNLEPGVLSIDDTEFLNGLILAMQQAGLAKEQIEERLEGMQIHVDLQDMNMSLNDAIANAANAGNQMAKNLSLNAVEHSETSTTEDTKENTGWHEEISAEPRAYTNMVLLTAGGFFGGFAQAVTRPVTSIVYEYSRNIVEDPVEATAVNQNTVHAYEVKPGGATKGVGGQISHKNASGGNKKSSGGKKGSGKKGGGKKGKGKKGSSSTPKTPKTLKSVKDTQDRYHDVNLKLKDTETLLKKVQLQQDKLTGPELLKNLDKQQKLLDKQVETYKEKILLEKQERDEVRNRLAKEGVTFDANGNIANYSTALSKALADYNAVIAKYNQMSAEDQLKNKYLLDNAKERYETIKSDISRYDKIVSEEIPNLEKSIRDAIEKQTLLNIEKFKLKVDMELDLAEAERDFNEFRDKVKKQLRDDDILGQAKSSFADLFTYYREGYNVVQGLTDQVQDTIKQINQIDRTGNSSVYGTDRAAAVKDLKDYMEQLMKNLLEVEDLVGDIKDSVYDAIDKAQDAFDNQRKEYEQISDLIDHNQKTIEMLYGDDAYKELEKYYQLQEKNNNKELDFLRKQKDMWYNRMTSEQNRMNSLTRGTNEWKEANDRFEEYKEHWIDALNDLNDQMLKSIENIIDKYTNAVDKIFKALENQLTNNKGYDHIEEEWELINKQADMYFDQVNRMYEIDKLENAYQDAIKDNDGNIKAQQSLNNLMNEQLKYLKDKDKLSQYDVDRANALLQIEIKRLALEQQRASKTKLRLRRDAQGNYTYQYTADPEANQQAEQELADAQNSLYNMTKEAYKNNLDSYYDTTTEWQDKVKDVYKDTTLTAEEQQQKIALLNEYYGEIINDLTRDNEDLKKFMMQDTFDEMAKMYDTNVENFQAMADAEKNIIMGDMVPYWKSGIQLMATSISESDEDFIPLVKDTFTELDKAASDYAKSLKAIETNTGTSFDQLANGIDKNISKTLALLEANKQLINGYDIEIAKVQDVIDKVQKLMEIYLKAKNEAIAATEAAYRFETMDASRLAANAGKVDATPINTNRALATANDLTTKSDDQLFNEFTKMLRDIYKYSSSFATGGYTGGWGDDGKIAVLHEKELVLNLKDTENMLSAVQITRTLDNILSNFKVNIDTSAAPAVLGSIPSVAENNNSEQYITINADFPAVQNQFEIEAAFDNLVNKASQYAFRTQR